MSAFTNLTLNTKVYSPSYRTGDTAGWMDRSAGIAAGYSLLTQRVYKAPENKGRPGAIHTTHKLTVPVLAEVDSSCSCTGSLLREGGFEVRSWSAETSTDAERLDLYLRLVDLVASDAFKDAFKLNTPVF